MFSMKADLWMPTNCIRIVLSQGGYNGPRKRQQNGGHKSTQNNIPFYEVKEWRMVIFVIYVSNFNILLKSK